MYRRLLLPVVLTTVALAGCGDAVAPGLSASDARLSASAAAASATLQPQTVPGQYIVLYRRDKQNHAKHTHDLLDGHPSRGRLKHIYSSALSGFAAQLSDSMVAALRADTSVVSIEADQVMSVTSTTETSAPWGLDRIDQRALPINGSYVYTPDGTGVTVYIIDTGINFTNVDFGGRAVPGIDEVTAGGTAVDCHGHGTHVAGTVGGTKYGVAKNVTLVAVRVLDCNGSGTSSGVVAGVDWVTQRKQANPSTPMVANMSLGGSASSAIDGAVANSVAAGVTYAVAAGNSTTDACTQSPARSAPAITVGATTGTDFLASFSNYGSCVDINAPGVSITSDYIGSTTATAVMSGTSMASPHVAGAAALYLSGHRTSTPAQVLSALASNATTGVISGLPAGTVNALLYVGFLNTGTSQTPATVTITPTVSSLTVAQTFQASAVVRDSSGNTLGTPVTWTSSNNGFATVSQTGLITAVAPGTVTITATAGTVSSSMTVNISAVPVATVSVSMTSSIVAGATATATVTTTDANGNVLTGRAITWSSSNAAVASVNAAGVVTGVAPGSATITATSEGKSGTATVSVTAASMTVALAPTTIAVGATATGTATLTDVHGNPIAGQTVTWTSNNAAVATVSATGVVTGVASGTATITATGAGKSGTATVTVTAGSVSVALNPTSIAVGATSAGTATVRDANGNVITGQTVTWTSSNAAVASVSATGVVTGVAPGTATMTATSGGKSGTATVTVTAASVSVTLGATSINVAATTTATATVRDVNGNAISGQTVTWTTSNAAVATVNASGVVTGVVPGSATITATGAGKSGSATVSVTVASVSVTLNPTSITVGATSAATATLRDANGNAVSGQSVAWSSSNTAVASVSATGTVTGVAAGTAVITATGGGRSGSATITVTASQAQGPSITVTLVKPAIAIGENTAAHWVIRDANGNVINPFFVQITSSNPSVASVTAGGLVTGVAVGTALIQVSYNGVTGSATVTVANSTTSLTITLSPASVRVGGLGQAIPTFRDANGNVVSGSAVTWTSSNPAVAPIASNGLYQGASAGTTVITATNGSLTATATLTVTP